MSSNPILEEFFPELMIYENQLVFDGLEDDTDYDIAIAGILPTILNIEPYTEEDYSAMRAFRNAEIYPQLELPLESGTDIELPLAA